MSLHRIRDILEADYGCEECPPDDPHAVSTPAGISVLRIPNTR